MTNAKARRRARAAIVEFGLRMQVEVGGTNLAELAGAILTGVGERHMPQFGFSTHAVKEAGRQH